MLFISAGTVFLAIGLVGAVVPLIPTTPFLILAAGCYARGSERMHRWLISNRLFGKVVSDYTQRRGITIKARWTAIGLLWFTIALSALFVGPSILMRLVLLAVAVGVTAHLLTLKTIHDAGD